MDLTECNAAHCFSRCQGRDEDAAEYHKDRPPHPLGESLSRASIRTQRNHDHLMSLERGRMSAVGRFHSSPFRFRHVVALLDALLVRSDELSGDDAPVHSIPLRCQDVVTTFT